MKSDTVNPPARTLSRPTAAGFATEPTEPFCYTMANSSGGKDRLSGITKAGNTYIRRLLVIGATSVIRYARSKAPGTAEWLKRLLDRKSARLASVALANKMARIAWSVLTRGEVYRATYPIPKPT